jgi:protein-disulfide isomerase
MANAGSKKWYTRWWAIILYILSALVILTILAPMPKQKNSSKDITSEFKQGNPNLTEREKKLLYDPDSPTYGTTSPEIKIVTFFCFSCPGAKQMHSTVREIGINYEDKVRLTFRHFPTSEKAIQYSLAAECAHEQGKFWPMYDKLFSNQNKLSPEYTFTLAKQINLDMNRFSECLMDDKILKKVTQDAREATELGVKGSPTTYINGYKIEKPIPEDVFKSIVENIINSENKN